MGSENCVFLQSLEVSIRSLPMPAPYGGGGGGDGIPGIEGDSGGRGFWGEGLSLWGPPRWGGDPSLWGGRALLTEIVFVLRVGGPGAHVLEGSDEG